MIPFPFNENRFSFLFFFFFCRPSTSWPVVYKSQERQEPSIMSESDTIFNERDRRCAAVQLMFSTDPSYDNRTIARTLKMQIRTVQRLRAQLNASDDPLEVVGLKPKAEDTARKTQTKEFIEKVQAIIDETPRGVVIPWCNLVAGGRFWVWKQDSAPAHKSKETQAWLQKECYDFVPFSHRPPSSSDLNPLDYFVWSYVENNTRRHPPNIRRAPAGACGKGMLTVPDPYRGGDWGWRRLNWIDVSSIT